MSTRDHIKERKCGMLALKITDIRDFTNKLFIGEVFDKFCLSEATVTTFNTFTIDGRLQKDFFDTDSMNRLTEHGRTHSLWKDIRPFCWSVIRGKRTPLSFRIVLHLSRSGVKASAPCFSVGVLFRFYLSIMLMDSIPTLPPRTTSICLNSSLISLMTASFLVAVWTNSRRRLSFP